MKLLVVEDDPKAARFLKKGLGEEGFVVDVCHDGEHGLQAALTGQYGLMVLDVMLPTLDGWGVVEEMRARACDTPVVMLTALDSVSHRIRGLSHGADDYLVKPFAFGELTARIRAVLRRRSGAKPIALHRKACRIIASIACRRRSMANRASCAWPLLKWTAGISSRSCPVRLRQLKMPRRLPGPPGG